MNRSSQIMHSPHRATESIRFYTVLSFMIMILLVGTTTTTSAVLYDDGQSHSIATSLNEAVTLRSSSTLSLPSGDDYTIRAPAGSDGAIRLYMSSRLNATGGEVIGADASDEHPQAGDGVIVGSASKAEFYDGVTVRGGNHLGADEYSYYLTADSTPNQSNDGITATQTTNFGSSNANEGGGGQGGDAILAQYYNSNVTIHGGTFIAGKGSIRDGHSLHSTYEATITVAGGSFYGSWKACEKGVIVVNGCVSRIGTRLVGRLENGHSLDVQVFEENGGSFVVNNSEDESCDHYNRRKHSPSSARGVGSSSVCSALIGMVLLLGFRLVLD